MGFGEQLVMGIVTAVLLLGPIAFLIWVWRRTASWIRVVRGVTFTVPAVSFLVSGGLAAVATACEVFVDWEDIADAFVTCGVYGAGFSWMGLLVTVPLIGFWYLAHRPSFSRGMAHQRAEPESLLPLDDW
ncbi:unnamed protein product [Gemmataceae bacterium]|nr:unnamed protein product [Gemmataceae bacterium]VTT98059.1 unnamed protein product [Gemmataceae bacterium]